MTKLGAQKNMFANKNHGIYTKFINNLIMTILNDADDLLSS